MKIALAAALIFAANGAVAAPDDWRLSGDLFGAALGPITYDRQSANSTAAGFDPQLASSGLRLGLEKGNPYGSLNVSLLGRTYQAVQNRVQARFTGAINAYSTVTDIKAQGFGLGASWIFWPPAKNRTFHLRAGLELERDRLSVRTKTFANDGSAVSSDSTQSILYAASAVAGLRWRLFANPFETDLMFSGLVPFYANAGDGISQHRARPGIEVGFTVLVTLPQPPAD